jgi:hypothetical protein
MDGFGTARLRRNFSEPAGEILAPRRTPREARSTILHKLFGMDDFLRAVQQTRTPGRGLRSQALRPGVSPSSLETAATAAIACSIRVANWPMRTARRSIGSNDTLPLERRVQVQR